MYSGFSDCPLREQTDTASAKADNSQAYLLSGLERHAGHGEFAFFGMWALRPDSDVNRGQQSRTADRGALYKTSSRDFLGFFIRCQCGGLLPVDPVRRTLVLHQSAPDLHAGVASRKLRYLLQAAFRRH